MSRTAYSRGACVACYGIRARACACSARAFGRPGPRITHPRPNQALNRGKQDTQRVIEDVGPMSLLGVILR